MPDRFKKHSRAGLPSLNVLRSGGSRLAVGSVGLPEGLQVQPLKRIVEIFRLEPATKIDIPADQALFLALRRLLFVLRQEKVIDERRVAVPATSTRYGRQVIKIGHLLGYRSHANETSTPQGRQRRRRQPVTKRHNICVVI